MRRRFTSEKMEVFVAEFFLRRKTNSRVSPTNLLTALKLGDSADCSRLKMTTVLRDLSDSLIRGILDERTLDLLETLEKLLLLEPNHPPVPTESHKSAYYWTAAECTARFMWPSSALEGLLNEAVERMTKRIGALKESESGLVTSELLKWETDLNKAVEDPEIYQQIRETNVRYTAVSFLNQLLKEQWELLGSSSLELFAARELKEYLKEIQREIDPSTPPPRTTRTSPRETPDDSSVRFRPHLPPTPEPPNVSPLKKAKPNVRRKKKYWTLEEEEALREGVKKYGKSWKEIKKANPTVLAQRTEVDLKDKWRNLTR